MEFKGADILSAKQFNRGDIETVLKTAAKMEPFASKKKWGDLLQGKLLASLFYEPSTRTRLSFETAMNRLGGRVVSSVGMQFSSLTKGETLYDTGRIVENYGDVIVMRHPDNDSVEKLARGANVPVINAGDGSNEHPTQSLLDLYTIQKELGRLDGLTIAMVGDLKFGRTVHSLSHMLSHFGAELIFVSPPDLKMPEPICRFLKEKNIVYKETADMGEAMKQANVLYMTRIQQERFEDMKEYEKHKGGYILTRELVEEKNPKLVIMHPLPRIWEITADTDDVPGAAYFRQVANGVAVRMAVLALVLGKTI
ncbi:aspartate carbamoyltransferase [Candidatus Peregrinibacteria bacterium]|nr:aspartate carbamoyltransferase [Candidatus Peregrinibacteria bacterium]